ncbi:tail assembly protein [Rouxiella badensis]|uniref:tail assembly protein n=1 Tax=Rouxiella badensis TaxID=1646377 RepID=UPI0028D74E40|nr:tail assembly protein [Rouxiella badensis]
MSVAIPEVKVVRLYGVAGTTFGRIHKLAVDNAQEAMKALCVVIPGFQKFLLESKEQGLTFAVFEGKKNLDTGTLSLQSNGSDIRIAPIIIGSKQAGVFQTILGAALVVVGAIGAFTPFGQAFGGAAWGPYAMQAGAGLMIGGVVQMLSPVQGGLASRQDPDNKPSYAFGGPVNTVAQGNPVPILYGRRRIGGAIISAGIYAEDQQ